MAPPGYGVTLRERDQPRRRHGAPAVGGRRHVVLLVHDPAADRQPRLRLVAARGLLLLRGGLAGDRAGVRRGAGPRGSSIGVMIALRGRAGRVGPAQGRWGQRRSGGARSAIRARRGDDGHRTHGASGRCDGDGAVDVGPRVPADPRPRSGVHRRGRAGRRGARRRRQHLGGARPDARRRRVHRGDLRRHAARPLVPHPARAARVGC